MFQLLKDRAFLHGTALLIGTMVGVGIFSIPLSFTKSGFIVGLLLAIAIGFITILINLIFAEIVLRTQKRHQLVGYTARYLGTAAKRVVLFCNVLGIWGALLAYIHYAGGFVSNVLSNFFYLDRELYSIVFFLIIGSLLLLRFKTVATVEFFLTGLFLIMSLSVFGVGIPHIDFANYQSINIPYWYLPYGVLLFAFAGLTSIPLQRQLLKGREALLKPSIITSVVFTGILYILFAFVVVGVSGFSTSDDSLLGLSEFLGPTIVILGSLFGVVAISTSFLMLGTALIDVFSVDYGVRHLSAWLWVIIPPFLLYMGGLRSAIDVISLVGAVAIGLESVILLYVFRRAKKQGDRKPEFSIHVPDWVTVLLGTVFIMGIIFELFIRY
jgi:amino acid permease